MANNSRTKTVRSLERGLAILDAVSSVDQSIGITDLSRHLGLAKGSVARLVATLAGKNYLVRDPVTAKYRLGLKIWEVGHRAVAGLDVREVARPVMERINAATRDTVHLSVLSSSGSMVFLDKLDSTKGIRPDIRLGAHLPPHCVANGKAILAFRPDEDVEKVLGDKLVRHTDSTITRKGALRAAFEEIRRTGYAVNRGEYRADVSGVAAPIRDHTGDPVAALGVSVPTGQMTPEVTADLSRRVVEAAQEISTALGQHRDCAPRMRPREPRPGDRAGGRDNNRPAARRNAGG